MNFQSVVLLILLITCLWRCLACSQSRRCLEDLDDEISKAASGDDGSSKIKHLV